MLKESWKVVRYFELCKTSITATIEFEIEMKTWAALKICINVTTSSKDVCTYIDDLAERITIILKRCSENSISLLFGWRALKRVHHGIAGNENALYNDITPSGTNCIRKPIFFRSIHIQSLCDRSIFLS